MLYNGQLLAVKSMEVTRSFYEKFLGQKVVMDLGINVCFEGGFSLQAEFPGLAGFPAERLAWKGHDGEVYFESTDFDADASKIKGNASVELLHDVKEYPWGQRVLRFFDPDGHIVELGENMDMVLGRFVAQGMSAEEISQRTGIPAENIRKGMEAHGK